jgi:hypothetical protein
VFLCEAKGHVDGVRERLDADLDARREADRAIAKRLEESVEQDAARGAQLDAIVHALRDRENALTTQAEAIGARMSATADVVREAAALLQAGGGELTAVAEMFASAVDRQREAATTWLESLGAVEAAVERAGENAAARALAEQLDRARELFDGQLEFHRELLVQLRSGRAHAASGARERHEGDAPA